MTQSVVFISYSHKNEKEKEKLLDHLGVLQQEGLIDLWSDDRIGAGTDWEQEIREAMARARVAILLISANFLNSDSILHKEVPILLQRHKSEGLTIFPVIAKPCAWQQVKWLIGMNVRPNSGKPIWRARGRQVDEDLATIAAEVATIVRTSRIQVYLKGDFSSLSDERKSAAIEGFAAIMGDLPREIEVYSVQEGSIVFDFSISPDATQRLRSLLMSNDAQLHRLKIEKVLLEIASDKIEEWVIKEGRFNLVTSTPSELPVAYLPIDRYLAIIKRETLPDQTTGAALFADISGFTPLTEALVKELGPRRGADELTQHLNAVYEALVQQVHHYGGSVITFGGDAITCWFDQDNGLRAIASGLAMQQAMQSFVALKTPGGVSISLAIKVAITAGPVRRFQIGNPDIQYLDVLAGATLMRLAELEHQAEKGEVVIGAEVIASLGDRVQVAKWRGEAKAGNEGKAKTKLEQPGDLAIVIGLTRPVEPAPSIIPPTFASQNPLWRSWLLPPVYQRLQSGQGQFLAEIRPAAALFVQFAGLDYDDDHEAGVKLDRYIRWVQNVLARQKGYLLHLSIGDKGAYFSAAFGAPLTYYDDVARAAIAALELLSPPPELNFISNIKIGLNQGRMRAGAYGSSVRRTYGVLGDEVNLAARLMQAAEPGKILVTQRLADTLPSQYRLESLAPIRVKGKQDPVAIAYISGRRFDTPQRPLFNLSLPPLVGRSSELARLIQLLQTVQNGEGQVICLAGPPGVGKSRLAAELIEQAISLGFQVSLGACPSAGQGPVYYPWRHIFRTLFDLTDEPSAKEELTAWTAQQIAQVEAVLLDINPDWQALLPLLGDLLGLTIPDNATTTAFDPQLRQEALFALVIDLLQAWADDYPSLVLIEDAHWLDEGSQRLTLAIARIITNNPLALVLVQRPQTGEDKPILAELNRLPAYQLLNLGELSAAGAAELVSNRLGDNPSNLEKKVMEAGVAELVSKRLPAQVQPLALALIQNRAQGNPFYLEEMVDTLLKIGTVTQDNKGVWSLSETTFEALQAAQCLVKDTATGEWTLAPQALLPIDTLQLPNTIHGLVLAHFDHLPENHKVTLKVASVIGASFEFESLSRTHLLQPDRTTLLKQVRDLVVDDFIRQETPPPRLTYMFRHNIIREVVYKTLPKKQRVALHQAMGETLELLHPEAVEQLAYHYSRSLAHDKTLFYLDKAAHKAQREYANETALNYYRQALALEERWSWRQGEVEVLHILGKRKAERASLERLQSSLGQEAEKLTKGKRQKVNRRKQQIEDSAHSFVVAYLWGQYYEAQGDYTEAQAAVERALAASRFTTSLADQIRCLAQLGLITRRQGDYNLAKGWYNQAVALFDNKAVYLDEQTQAFTQALNGLGIIHRQQGEFDQARACHEQALTLSRQSGNRQGEALALDNLGAVDSYRRQFSQATTYYQQALETRRAIGDRPGEGTSLMNLSQVAAEMGDYSQTQNYLLQALTIQQATGNRWEELNIWNDLGVLYQELGSLTTAQTCLERGLQLSREIGDKAGKAYLLSNLGLVMHDQGNLETAEKKLVKGLTLAQEQEDRDLVSGFFSYLSLVTLQAGRYDQTIDQAQAALAVQRELKLYLRTADNLATLAATHLVTGHLVEAVDYARQVLTILEKSGGEGPEFPQRDYFICYQVLAAAGEEEPARTALYSAYNLVIDRAEKIIELPLRQSFLERVAVNREIITEYERRREMR